MQQQADSQTDSHGHGHDHPPHLAHHFETPKQQFESGKLGMWLFLATEVLLFGGLFTGYSILRANNPEVFAYASQFLDTTLGATNTVVLLLSSFTMAWSVRNAQLNQQTMLKVNLIITFVCATTFMVIKYFEYDHKIHDGLMWGTNYQVQNEGMDTTITPIVPAEGAEGDAAATPVESSLTPAAEPPSGLTPDVVGIDPPADSEIKRGEPLNVHKFFGIYFVMTGLHGFHVLGGMGMIIWLLIKAQKKQFSSEYFTPVDLGALYWHIVDLIWIFLFPLLYLI